MGRLRSGDKVTRAASNYPEIAVGVFTGTDGTTGTAAGLFSDRLRRRFRLGRQNALTDRLQRAATAAAESLLAELRKRAPTVR
jgi:hypothetical protein